MCYFEYMGLRWQVPSPSFWKLAHDGNPEEEVDVSYLGDVWMLSHKRNGVVVCDTYDSRDAAIAVVAQAFRNVGAI